MATAPDVLLLESISITAQRAARQAGALIRARAGNVDVAATKASSMDLVTVVDKECQTVIQGAFADAHPEVSFLGEESVPAGSEASASAIADYASRPGFLAIVDPIDGTTNFVHSIPFSAVSIGVAYNGIVVVGVIYEPYRDEMFTAIRGQGAFLNGSTRLHVSTETSMGSALFAYGLHNTKHVCQVMIKGLSSMSDVTRGCRSLGSAATHLAYVAAGRFTGFWELDLSSWDLAAGSLLVQEAGGIVTDTRGAPYTLQTRDCLATNGAPIHDGALAALVAVHADRI
jgi:myo-inositol-1(or 4)-monophosphatase